MLESETILITGARVIINVPNHVDLNDAFTNKQNKRTVSAQIWYVPFSHAPATLKRKAFHKRGSTAHMLIAVWTQIDVRICAV